VIKEFLTRAGDFIRKIIDYSYPPFRKFVPQQIFHYGISGGINLVFDWVLYFLIFNFVLRKQMLDLVFVTLSSHVAAFALKFPITLLSGFFLQKYVTFSYSIDTKGRVQLLRYFGIVIVNVVIYYFGLKFFVESVGLFPSIANVIMSIFTSIVGYAGQKFFTFK